MSHSLHKDHGQGVNNQKGVDDILSHKECSCASSNVKKITEELERYKDVSLRMKADYDNFRKEVEKNRSDVALMLKADIIGDLLPILDNWSSAWNHLSEDEKKQPSIVGIGYIKQQLEDLVRSYGVVLFRPNVGDTLDYTKHEALNTEISNDPKKHHTIARVLRDGYVLGDMIVRPAGVVVYVEKEEKEPSFNISDTIVSDKTTENK